MSLISLLLIVVNIGVSLIGFRNVQFFNRYAFSVDGIIRQRQYDRFITSIFLHVDYVHLFFNMFSFYSFAIYIEKFTGGLFLLLLFFGSALGGDFLALFIHRRHPRYRAAGASGAISGVIFASVLLFPEGRIMVFPVPIGLPTWLFAIIFVLISVYGIGKQTGNIGHEAHLGGALTGILITGLFFPAAVLSNILLTLLLILPVAIFLWIIVKNPGKIHLRYQQKENREGKEGE